MKVMHNGYENNKENKLFLDLHVLQSLPPSNINRDDSGSLSPPCLAACVDPGQFPVLEKAMRDYLRKT